MTPEERVGPTTVPWWRRSVIYQIYPRSFADTDGDGIGDLEGVRRHLDHLTWLGVDGLWLSPIYRSPMADFGYDVSDHCDIDPTFGDLDAFDRMLADAHDVDLRVLLDWVPNHTSDRHRWFLASRSSRDDPKRDWYLWRESRDGGEPNNWVAAWSGSNAWTWDEPTRQWYLHLFLPEQPDLNWANPEVAEAMHDVLRFWLERGVDGFRADVVHLIGKDEALPDQPEELSQVHLALVHDHPNTHRLLRGIRGVLDGYAGERTMVGEVNLGSAALLAPYYGQADELHMVFNFTLLRAPWAAARWAERIVESELALAPSGAWPVWVLNNHDERRARTRYGGSEGRARVAAVVLLTLRGTPFLYAGEELGLLDAVVPEDRRIDPGGRDGCRAPFPWTAGGGHGWGEAAWLPFAPEAGERAVDVQRSDETSILWLYRRLLRARRASAALQHGSWTALDAPDGVLAYERRSGNDVRRIVANFTDRPASLRWASSNWIVDVASDVHLDDHGWAGVVEPEQALVLQPS